MTTSPLLDMRTASVAKWLLMEGLQIYKLDLTAICMYVLTYAGSIYRIIPNSGSAASAMLHN